MAGPSLEGIVNPRVLAWARRSCQLDPAQVARSLGVKEEKIAAWEVGQAVPTLRQLRMLANVYRRSVGVFFLNDVPEDIRPPADFRRLELSAQRVMSKPLAVGIRAAEAKRESALEIYSQAEDEPPQFALQIPPNADPEEVATWISGQLRISMDQRRQWANEYEALNAWRAAVEALGVLVMQVSEVAVAEMRGCSIALFPLPIIILNSGDRPLGRVFSLLHELVHLARAESGLCDVFEDADRGENEQQTEAYCNRVAGAILVPSNYLLAQPMVARAPDGSAWEPGTLAELRRTFWASREAILRRLLIFGKTTRAFYNAERERMRREYENDEGDRSGGFVSFPRKVVLANGRFLTRLALGAFESEVITGSELSRILGTKLDHLPKIRAVLGQEAA